MTNKPSLQLRQSQSLVMTHQLRQSIQLLQYSALELGEFIDQELEKNPLLLVEEGSDSSAKEMQEERKDQGESLYTNSLDMEGEGVSKSASVDTDNEAIWGGEFETQHYIGAGSGGHVDLDSASEVIEQRYSEAQSLKDHILEQVQLEIQSVEDRMIAVYMVDLLDEAGYLREEIDGIASQLGAERDEVKRVLERLKRFEPPGVFAKDLRECLYLQLREKDYLDDSMEALLKHLELIGDNPKKLAKLCGVDDETLKDMILDIRALDPRPGSHFSHEQVETLIPDVIVRRIGKSWRVELNTDVLPKLLINRQYQSMLYGRSRNKIEKKFINEQLANANWLLKALDQRAQSMLKVTTEIVKQQEMFFEHGIKYLRPMTLRTIAEEVELHESTVSRITHSKYLASPRGIFPLKFFFSSSLSDAADGEGTSSRTVMHLIQEMVDAEKPTGILSDDAIAKMLGERGIDIARRTVVKYRQAMNIPSSTERRREKRGR